MACRQCTRPSPARVAISRIEKAWLREAINERAYSVECERQRVMPETTAFKRHAAKHERKKQLLITLAHSLSGFTTQRTAKG